MRTRGVALYMVVALLAVLGFLGVSLVWIAAQHSQSALQTWVEAEAQGVEVLALRELSISYLPAVEGALRSAIASNANLNLPSYLANPSQVAVQAQSGLTGTQACPSQTLTKPGNRSITWRAYLFLANASACGRTPADLSIPPPPSPARSEGADRTTWTAGFMSASNSPMQVYTFPLTVYLETEDSASGIRTRSLYRGEYRAFLHHPHLGWWTLGAYTSPLRVSEAWSIRGKVYAAPAPILAPPFFLSGSLHTARCSTGGPGCTRTNTVLLNGQSMDYRNLLPSPWAPCASTGCARISQGVDWTAMGVAFPTESGSTTTGSVTTTSYSTSPVLRFSVQGNSQLLTVISGGSSTTYTISRGAAGFRYGFWEYPVLLLNLRFTDPTLRVEGGTLHTGEDFTSRVRITVTAQNIVVRGSILGSPNPCETTPPFSCSGRVLPVLLAAGSSLSVETGDVQAFLLSPSLTLPANPRIFGGIHYQNLSLPGNARVILTHNPAAAEMPFPQYSPASVAQPAGLTFTGLVRVF